MKENHVHPALTIVILAIIVIMGVVLYRNQVSNKTVNNQVAPTRQPTFLNIEQADSSKTPVLGQPLVLKISADSNSEEVVGYDVLVNYDTEAFTFTSAESLNSDFDVYPNTSKKHLSLTVVKKQDSRDPAIFKNEDVLSLTFQPLKKGVSSFSIEPSIGKEKTKLTNPKTETLLPYVSTLSVEIR